MRREDESGVKATTKRMCWWAAPAVLLGLAAFVFPPGWCLIGLVVNAVAWKRFDRETMWGRWLLIAGTVLSVYGTLLWVLWITAT